LISGQEETRNRELIKKAKPKGKARGSASETSKAQVDEEANRETLGELI
jgi:hypothetical protein